MAEQHPPPPPNPNRIITDTDAAGESVFSAALPESLAVFQALPGGQLTRLAYTTDARPPLQLGEGATDLASYQASLQPGAPPTPLVGTGTHVWYVDTPPGAESRMHRTVSIDFFVQLVGELELTLSDGDVRILRPGDLAVQRATMHKWRNPSKTEWARGIAVVTESQKVQTKDGQTLDQEFLAWPEQS